MTVLKKVRALLLNEQALLLAAVGAVIAHAIVIGQDPISLIAGTTFGPTERAWLVVAVFLLVGWGIRSAVWSAGRHRADLLDALGLDAAAGARLREDLEGIEPHALTAKRIRRAVEQAQRSG